MNTNKYLAWCSACIVILVGVLTICLAEHIEYQVTSTPVEEMYHRQLVTTIDSILDSRYPCGVTEDDSAYPFTDSFSSIAVPNNR